MTLEDQPSTSKKYKNAMYNERTVHQRNVKEKGGHFQWTSQVQFVLSALGLSVGLGNIWRFPYVAYENGGATFLIVYLCCGLFFGFPMVYAEFLMGQYSRSRPGNVMGRYAAGFRGVGWCMAVNSLFVAIYYCVIIAWAEVYFGWIVSGQSWRWTECGNKWNTDYCVSQSWSEACAARSSLTPYYFMGNCTDTLHTIYIKQPSEEFFTNYITKRSNGISNFETFNWPVFSALFVLWIFIAAILIKGMKLMRYLTYAIVPFPYMVVMILFFRGITLPGAHKGIDYFLLKPNIKKILNYETWAAALKQLMFSMSIGYGGLISLSSYSKHNANFFRDSIVILLGDTIMSIIGGIGVFSVLGYMADSTGKAVPDVVASGATVAFVVFPEAVSKMAVPWLWNILFFLVLFFLGVTSLLALVDVFTGVICDCFPKAKKRRWLVIISTCVAFEVVSLLMVTHAGWYWFLLFDEFTGSTAVCIVAAAEVLILSLYGWKMIKIDLTEMRGPPQFSGIGRWFSSRSPIFPILWATLCPLLAFVIAGFQLAREVPFKIQMNTQGQKYAYPVWAEIIGWFLNLGSLIPIPAFFIYKWMQFKKEGQNFHYLFRPTKRLPSYKRYYEKRGIPPPEKCQKRDVIWEIEDSI